MCIRDSIREEPHISGELEDFEDVWSEWTESYASVREATSAYFTELKKVKGVR